MHLQDELTSHVNHLLTGHVTRMRSCDLQDELTAGHQVGLTIGTIGFLGENAHNYDHAEAQHEDPANVGGPLDLLQLLDKPSDAK